MDTVAVQVRFPKDVYLGLQAVGWRSAEKFEKELKESAAMALFRQGVFSLGQAAELAGMAPARFMEHLIENGVAVVEYQEEDYAQDTAAGEKLRRAEKL